MVPLTIVKAYGGAWNDHGYGIKSLFDGGYIVTGGISSDKNFDMWLLKLDSYGNKVWEKTFASPYEDIGLNIIITNDNGYALFGDYHLNHGNGSIFRTDSAGNLIAENVPNSSLRVVDGRQTSDGGFIVTGASGNCLGIVKMNTAGNQEWATNFGINENGCFGEDIEITSDGGFIIFGMTNRWTSNAQARFIKTDALGNVQWNTVWGDVGEDWLRAGEITNDGGYIATGHNSTNVNDIVLVKLNASGAVQWSKTFGGTGSDVGLDVKQRANGNYVIAGYWERTETGQDAVIIETDSNGNLLHQQFYGGTGEDFAASLILDSTGAGYTFVGTTNNGAGNQDLYFVRSSATSVPGL